MALSDLDSITNTSEYLTGETVDGAEQASNENLLKAKINEIIVELKAGRVVERNTTTDFTAEQTFTGGLKTNAIANIGTADLIFTLATGLLKYGGSNADHEVANVARVNALIASLTGTNFDLLYGGAQTGNFNAVASTLYDLDFSSNSIEATLPASPAEGTVIGFRNYLSDDGIIDSGRTLKLISASHNVQNGTSTSSDPETLESFVTLYLQYNSARGWLML